MAAVNSAASEHEGRAGMLAPPGDAYYSKQPKGD